MVACRYEKFLLVFNLTSHSFAALNRELPILTLEERFHIYAHTCIILYILSDIYVTTSLCLQLNEIFQRADFLKRSISKLVQFGLSNCDNF